MSKADPHIIKSQPCCSVTLFVSLINVLWASCWFQQNRPLPCILFVHSAVTSPLPYKGELCVYRTRNKETHNCSPWEQLLSEKKREKLKALEAHFLLHFRKRLKYYIELGAFVQFYTCKQTGFNTQREVNCTIWLIIGLIIITTHRSTGCHIDHSCVSVHYLKLQSPYGYVD